MKNPELIDAAFVNLVQYYKGSEDELQNQTIILQSMPFEEQMVYSAIIDIDGNNWSSRFASLLCTNSVIIKVRVYCYECAHYIKAIGIQIIFRGILRSRSIQITLNPSTWSRGQWSTMFLHHWRISPE
jgi:hypothetical protein